MSNELGRTTRPAHQVEEVDGKSDLHFLRILLPPISEASKTAPSAPILKVI